VLAACATFFGVTINAFGIETTEKFELTKKYTSRNAQINREEMNALGKLVAAFGQASRTVAEELEVNGIETGFIADQHEPSLEIVKQNIPAKCDPSTPQTQNLIELTFHYWHLKELFDSCMAVLKDENFINFDPIEKTIQGGSEDKENRVLKYLFPDSSSDQFHAILNISTKPYIKLDGSIALLDNDLQSKDWEAIRVMGPYKISVGNSNPNIMFWMGGKYVLMNPLNDIQFLKCSCAFTKAAYNNSFRTRYLDEKNISNISSNNCFLNSLYSYYQKVKSDRILGFDPLTMRIPHDIISDEAKRQVKMAHQYLKKKYMQDHLTDKFQQPIPDQQALLELRIIEEGESIIGDEVKCIEYLPKVLTNDIQESKSDRQTDLKKDEGHKHKRTRKAKEGEGDRQKESSTLQVVVKKEHRHKHKSSRKDKSVKDDHQKDKTALQVVDKKEHRRKHKRTRKTTAEKDERQKNKTALQGVDKKEHSHKHKRTQKPKAEKDESKNLVIVRQAEVENNNTQKPNAALQALLEFKRIEAEAEMYALQNNKTKYELREYMTGVYKENYEQLEHLHLAFTNLGELYNSAIFQKMDENKKYLETIFSKEDS
jgi:hypothetical protein